MRLSSQKFSLNRPLSKLADASKVQGASGAQPRSVYGILDEASTGATQQFAAAVELTPLRPLSKLADASKVQGASGAQPRSVYGILDEVSTGATQQFAAAVEFGKRSNEALEIFLLYLATERGLSTNYQLSTRASLERFLSWLKSTTGITSEREVTSKQLYDFLTAEKKRGLVASSLKLEAVALRIFFRFLVARRLIESDPAEKLPLPRLPQPLPQPLSPAEMERLLMAPSGKDLLAVRDRAILELLYASGLRISELCQVRLEQLDRDEGMIRVTGKGDKTRLVPVGQSALNALENYLSSSRPQLLSPKSGAAIFLSVRGHPLTPARIWQLVRYYSRQAGLTTPAHPHQLRHSFATHLLRGGADLRIIQEMLGHASIATTQVYTQVDRSHLKAIHHQFHPRG